jgi:hypothetical protein
MEVEIDGADHRDSTLGKATHSPRGEHPLGVAINPAETPVCLVRHPTLSCVLSMPRNPSRFGMRGQRVQ